MYGIDAPGQPLDVLVAQRRVAHERAGDQRGHREQMQHVVAVSRSRAPRSARSCAARRRAHACAARAGLHLLAALDDLGAIVRRDRDTSGSTGRPAAGRGTARAGARGRASGSAWRGAASSVTASRLTGVTAAAALMCRMISFASSSTASLNQAGVASSSRGVVAPRRVHAVEQGIEQDRLAEVHVHRAEFAAAAAAACAAARRRSPSPSGCPRARRCRSSPRACAHSRSTPARNDRRCGSRRKLRTVIAACRSSGCSSRPVRLRPPSMKILDRVAAAMIAAR